MQATAKTCASTGMDDLPQTQPTLPSALIHNHQRASWPVAEADLDDLTGAWNRARFTAVLERSMDDLENDRVESVCALFIDLDRFKQVNDTLGHAIGDDLLKLVAKRISGELEAFGGSLARLGGDEFGAMLAPAPGIEALSELAQRLIDLVQRTYLIEGHVIHVGASIGIAIAPQDGLSCKELLRRSDLALYAAKSAGRGTSRFFTTELEDAANHRRANEMALRKALVLRQMTLFYQPQRNVETGRVASVKVQLSWKHPQRGFLSESEFMPLAEEIGMAVPIGEWMLKAICVEAKKWPDGPAFAVHVGAHYFEDPGFFPSVVQALAKAGLPGKSLEIEVTEEVLLRNHPSVSGTLEALQRHGVGVTLDDFGTGVASLSQLAKLPFDKIKIGRALMGLQHSDPKDRAIVRAISALGESLGVKTHAEGMESRAHLDQVRSDGCVAVQGFCCDAAVSADELRTLLNS
ncbi:MAG: putative bifunctional diguanylate cyclase/phosphodiesterase [Janthinobacterium lividum]